MMQWQHVKQQWYHAVEMISHIARQGYYLITISCIGYDITHRRLPDKDYNAMSRKATISRKDEMQWKCFHTLPGKAII